MWRGNKQKKKKQREWEDGRVSGTPAHRYDTLEHNKTLATSGERERRVENAKRTHTRVYAHFCKRRVIP